jgi:cobalamin biosynthesis Mg chelatase CobN
MKSHRKIILIVVLALLGALVPASASASSILSGYGGPGQGTQSILGSTLLNGPSRGGGAGAQLSASAAPATSGAGSAGGGSGSRTGSRAAPRTRAGASRPTRQVSGGADAARPVSTLAISRASAGGSGVLGLSPAAFLVVLLALAALVFTGLLTRGLAKPSGTREHAGS